MIDYIKLRLLNIDIEALKSRIDFSLEYIPTTDETNSRYFYDFHHCKICLFPTGTILFKGSLHKMWNSLTNQDNGFNGGFNGNDFTYSELLCVLAYLKEVFDCEYKDMLIQRMEVGVNVQTLFNPRLFVKGLLFHKGKSFQFGHNKHYAECIHSEYIIKIYDKSIQYNLDNYTLRVEVKYKKSKPLKSFGIKTVDDLSELSLNNCFNGLLKLFDQSVHYDYTIRENELEESLKHKVKNFKNDLYFLEQLNKRQRFREKAKLKKIVIDYSSQLKSHIRDIIEVKKELLCPYSIE